MFREDGHESVMQPENIRAETEEGLPKHLVVDEVVRNEESMHFYQVPRLGSYLAIRLEYESCLNEEAFDAAVLNYTSVNTQTREEAAAKAQFEEDQEELKEAKAEAGEPFEPEERQWAEFEYSDFKT